MESKPAEPPSSSPSSGASPSSRERMLHLEYLQSVPGIMKIIEIALDFIVFISALSNYFSGHGWVQFVGISSLLTTAVVLLMYLFGVLKKNRVRRFRLVIPEFIYCGICALLFVIAGIVAAVRAGEHASVAIAMVGCFAAMAVYAIESVWQYRAWKTEEADTPYATQTA